MTTPTLDYERAALVDAPVLIACDEVGRGALAGPVAVGAVVFDRSLLATGSELVVPEGLRDSKLVPEPRRAALARVASEWVACSAVGWASADEIDQHGIIHALGLAAHRAMGDLGAHGVDVGSARVLLDGNHDYISRVCPVVRDVRPVVKADRDCASASAASIIAKVARDQLMRIMHADAPVYAWDRNKGYGSPTHRAAIREHGVSPLHRASWALTGASSSPLF